MKYLKNYLCCLVLTILFFSLIGCGGSGSGSDPVVKTNRVLRNGDTFVYDTKTVTLDVVATNDNNLNAVLDTEVWNSGAKANGDDSEFAYVQDKNTGVISFATLTLNGSKYNVDLVYAPAFPAEPEVGYTNKITMPDGKSTMSIEITGIKNYTINGKSIKAFKVEYTITASTDNSEDIVFTINKYWSQDLGWYVEDDDSVLQSYTLK